MKKVMLRSIKEHGADAKWNETPARTTSAPSCGFVFEIIFPMSIPISYICIFFLEISHPSSVPEKPVNVKELRAFLAANLELRRPVIVQSA
jgi:hypothetical protein